MNKVPIIKSFSQEEYLTMEEAQHNIFGILNVLETYCGCHSNNKIAADITILVKNLALEFDKIADKL